MKVLPQWAAPTPRGYEALLSADWAAAAREAGPVPPQGLQRDAQATLQQLQRGRYLHSLNQQSVVFTGYDHYAVEHLSGGRCRVYAWIDDPEDYPGDQHYARVWTFDPLAPDPRLGGAYNTRQSQVIYGGDAILRYYDRLGDVERTVVRPLGEFVPPDADGVLHGLWLPAALHALHDRLKEPVSWREWTDGLPAEEVVLRTWRTRYRDGRVAERTAPVLRPQRSLGRYDKPVGTKTFGLRDLDEASAPHAVTHEDRLTRDVFGAGETETSDNIGGDASALIFVHTTPTGEPNDADWPSGNYRCQIETANVGADLSYGYRAAGASTGHFARVAGGADAQTWAQTEALFTGAGIKGPATTGTIDPSAGATSDLFEVLLAVTRAANHGNQSMDMVYDADAFADGPWTELAPPENKSGSDSGTLTDTADPLGQPSGSETAVLVEAIGEAGSLVAADTASMDEAAMVAQAKLAADSGNLTETASVVATLSGSEAPTLAEIPANAGTLVTDDTATLADTGVSAQPKTDTDSATLAESATIQASATGIEGPAFSDQGTTAGDLSATDTGTETDDGAVSQALTGDDTASFAEAVEELLANLSASETTSLADTGSVQSTGPTDLTDSDSGSFTELATVTVTLIDTDGWSLTDTDSGVGLLAVTDTATLTDTGSASQPATPLTGAGLGVASIAARVAGQANAAKRLSGQSDVS